jgi:cell division protease FtsH
MPEARSYSEQTARLVDEEIRKMVSEALDRARHVLNVNREKVEALAARLLATEVIDEDDMTKILGPKVLARRGVIHPEARQVVAAHPSDPPAEVASTQHTDALPDA